MGLGLGEMFILLVSLILVLGIPAVIIIVAILLIRRIRGLEARVANLEGKQESRKE